MQNSLLNRHLVRYQKKCIYIIKPDVCVSVCQHSDVRLSSPPVLKVWGTQGFLWLPYDLLEVIKLIGERFEPKIFFFSKKYFMSFLPHYCHSFRITVIPSVLLSFLPDFCHSFRIFVIPSKFLSFLLKIVIPSVLLSFCLAQISAGTLLGRFSVTLKLKS